MTRRTDRLNSLLKEVISDVIRKEIKHAALTPLLTITSVEITKDLHHAKVFFSVIGTDAVRQETLHALQSAAGFIAVKASKQVVLRYFPELHFIVDMSAEKFARIDTLLTKIEAERESRSPTSASSLDDDNLEESSSS